MFSQPNKSNEDKILECLAHAYKCYKNVDWDYGRADAGTGGFLVDGCITDAKQLNYIATIIGKGAKINLIIPHKSHFAVILGMLTVIRSHHVLLL